MCRNQEGLRRRRGLQALHQPPEPQLGGVKVTGDLVKIGACLVVKVRVVGEGVGQQPRGGEVLVDAGFKLFGDNARVRGGRGSRRSGAGC